MSDRNPTPAPHPLVIRLTRADSETDTEDVVALVGLVGTGAAGRVRLFSDQHLQRWLDLPADAVVDSFPVDPEDELSQTVVWVTREAMREPMFSDSALEALEAEFIGAGMSTWPLIPDSRYVAAAILDLLPRWDESEYEEGA